MGGVPARPSLAHRSLFSLAWHVSVWGGWALVVVSAVRVQPIMGQMPASFWVVAALVLLGELRPVRTAGSWDAQGTVTSTAFVFAIMYMWGLWPALLLQAGVTVTSEMVKHKPPWKLFFNVGQYVLSASAAFIPMVVVGLPHGLVPAGRSLTGTDLLWIVPTWVIWFVVNNVLVSGVAADVGRSFWRAFTDDLGYYIVTSAAVLALSPLVVLAAMSSPWFVPLLLMYILWRMFRNTRDQFLGGGILSGFSKSPAKRYEESGKKPITFNSTRVTIPDQARVTATP